MPQPLWRKLVPLPVQRTRVVRTELMPRVEQLVKGGVVPKPLWFDAMKAHPPPSRRKAEKPKRLVFPEDRLRRVWLRRNPEATMYPKTLFVEDDALPAGHPEHPADAFVARQMELMRKGMGEEEAYRAVLEQQREERTESPEATDALRAALSFGATPSGSQTSSGGKTALSQELLRKFAEEAKAARMPYPEHWFDADGQWVGIRTQPAAAPSKPPARQQAPPDGTVRGGPGESR